MSVLRLRAITRLTAVLRLLRGLFVLRHIGLVAVIVWRNDAAAGVDVVIVFHKCSLQTELLRALFFFFLFFFLFSFFARVERYLYLELGIFAVNALYHDMTVVEVNYLTRY